MGEAVTRYDERMFERFTDDARRVVVLAQEEARLLRHNYIGTEHLVLALTLGRSDTPGIIEWLGFSHQGLQEHVETEVGPGSEDPSGHIPFTPNARRILKASLTAALQLNSQQIRPEHMLIAIARTPGCVAYRVLGLDEERSQQIITAISETLTGAPLPDPPDAQDMSAQGPMCRGCRAELTQHLAHRTITSTDPAGDSVEVTIAYCGRCGLSVGTVR